MIPSNSTIVDSDSLPGEEIEFGIGDPRWVMRNNADLYSDVTTAIIREYSTNAYDAHVMAGNPNPIRVTLPSAMHTFFTIEDEGVGMNLDLFKRVYTQFGISDKRDSNKTNGLYGYGSKSGVAYTDQFSVTSIRDGIRIDGIIKRRPDWSIVLKVVSTTKTDAPNGTKITIPVHNIEEFNHKAMEFYKFWLPGRVLVNGKEPRHAVGKKIAENFYHSEQWNTSYVVLGNVAYRVNNPSVLFTNTKMNHVNFVAYVDGFTTEDGTQPVDYTPSREDLKYTEKTKATLQAIVNQFEADIIATAKSEIDNAKSHAEAYAKWTEWTSRLGRQMFADLEFKGDKLRPKFNISGTRYSTRSSRNSAHRISEWDVASMDKTMVVTEYPNSLSSRHKRMVKDYAQAKGWDVAYALFTLDTAKAIVSPWIPRDKFVTWAEVKAATPKAPRGGGNSNHPNAGRVSGSWDYYDLKGRNAEQPIPDDVDNLYYIGVQEDKCYLIDYIMKLANLDNAAVLVVPANRLPKLRRENPQVKNFIAEMRNLVVHDAATLLDDDSKVVMSIGHSTKQWLNMLDMTKVKDPEPKKMLDKIANLKSDTVRYQHNLDLANALRVQYTVKQYTPGGEGYNVLTKYPLMGYYPVTRMGRAEKVVDHIYMYMNAVHAAESEK